MTKSEFFYYSYYMIYKQVLNIVNFVHTYIILKTCKLSNKVLYYLWLIKNIEKKIYPSTKKTESPSLQQDE